MFYLEVNTDCWSECSETHFLNLWKYKFVEHPKRQFSQCLKNLCHAHILYGNNPRPRIHPENIIRGDKDLLKTYSSPLLARGKTWKSRKGEMALWTVRNPYVRMLSSFQLIIMAKERC